MNPAPADLHHPIRRQSDKPNKLAVLLGTTLLLIGTGVSADRPVCVDPASDSDGDGWGWENNQSCVVESTGNTGSGTGNGDNSGSGSGPVVNGRPICALTDSDADGDGWGWENNQSCIVSDDSTDAGGGDTGDGGNSDGGNGDSGSGDGGNTDDSGRPFCVNDDSDPDGDGWGWENNLTCVVGEPASGGAGDGTGDNGDGGGDGSNGGGGVTPDSGIIFEQDFEIASEGLYQADQLNEDWNNPYWHLGFDQGRVEITVDEDNGNVMQVRFPAGGYGSSGATAFLTDVHFAMGLPESYDELYIRYDMKFRDGFEFVKGGKLPGLCGSDLNNTPTSGCNTGGGIPTGYDGWSARGMWRENGALENYLYHSGQSSHYGDDRLWNIDAETDRWYTVQHRVVMNSIGNADGIVQAWVDGTMVLDANDIEYRKIESIGINLFYFSTFFGGNDPSWAPDTDQYMYFDNFVISTEPQN